MKVCLECGENNEDDARACITCGSQRFRDSQAAVPSPAPPASERPPDSTDAARAAGPDAAPRSDQTSYPGNEPEPEAEAPYNEALLGRQILSPDNLPPPGLFVIGLLGFETAGKSWFLFRLKEHAFKGWKITPPAVPEGTRLSAIQRTTKITEHLFEQDSARFAFVDIPGEMFRKSAEGAFEADEQGVFDAVLQRCDALVTVLPALPVLLGDSLVDPQRRRTAQARSEGTLRKSSDIKKDLAHHGEKVSDDPSQAALNRARFARLSADLAEALDAESADQAGVEDMVVAMNALPPDSNSDDLAALEAAADVAREKRLAEGVVQMSSFEYRLPHLIDRLRPSGDRRPLEKPVYVALAKMDEVVEPSNWLARKFEGKFNGALTLDSLDADPDVILGERRKGLLTTLEANFEWWRLGWVSAFPRQGEEANPVEITYAREPYGLGDVAHWIHWARTRKRAGFIQTKADAWARGFRRAERVS